jgi:hypothetical protein
MIDKGEPLPSAHLYESCKTEFSLSTDGWQHMILLGL